MKNVLLLLLACILAVVILFINSGAKAGNIEKNSSFEAAAQGLLEKQTKYMQDYGLDPLVNGKSLKSFGYTVYVDDDMKVCVTEDFLEDIMGCSVNAYPDGEILIERNSVSLKYKVENIISKNEKIYIPISDNIHSLGYDVEYSFNQGTVNFVSGDDGSTLPAVYDLREKGRVTPVRDQGELGTCWAFASLGALETVTLPMEENIYSVDHMSQNNGYSMDVSEGGEHSMSLAYMAAWQGPVYEKDDIYGDGKTEKGLKAVKHLEEAIIINKKDEERVKKAIYKYGGVETSIYLEMTYGGSESEFYNSNNASYYYNGKERPNHDLVVVGWDDNYSKTNFTVTPSRDGAYICKNSWGENFGDKGYFYISYDDVNICNESIVYTRLAEPDNYDNIYQADLLGWVGQMGFKTDSAYFANVFTAKNDEVLKAVSFYATGDNTSFTVFVVTDYENQNSLNAGRKEVGKGETRYSGYYTVDLNQDIHLEKDKKYAIIISVKTPGSTKPIAIECSAGERTDTLDLTDGEGYMSLYGEVWHSAEDADANICLKAFTDNE